MFDEKDGIMYCSVDLGGKEVLKFLHDNKSAGVVYKLCNGDIQVGFCDIVRNVCTGVNCKAHICSVYEYIKNLVESSGRLESLMRIRGDSLEDELAVVNESFRLTVEGKKKYLENKGIDTWVRGKSELDEEGVEHYILWNGLLASIMDVEARLIEGYDEDRAYAVAHVEHVKIFSKEKDSVEERERKIKEFDKHGTGIVWQIKKVTLDTLVRQYIISRTLGLKVDEEDVNYVYDKLQHSWKLETGLEVRYITE